MEVQVALDRLDRSQQQPVLAVPRRRRAARNFVNHLFSARNKRENARTASPEKPMRGTTPRTLRRCNLPWHSLAGQDYFSETSTVGVPTMKKVIF